MPAATEKHVLRVTSEVWISDSVCYLLCGPWVSQGFQQLQRAIFRTFGSARYHTLCTQQFTLNAEYSGVEEVCKQRFNCHSSRYPSLRLTESNATFSSAIHELQIEITCSTNVLPGASDRSLGTSTVENSLATNLTSSQRRPTTTPQEVDDDHSRPAPPR